MNPILNRLKNGEILVSDGAMGTMLFQSGLIPGECPESFNLSHPEVLKDIAGKYFKAGADIINTNTFGGSPLKLSDYKLEDKTEEINKNAVSFVKEIIGGSAYVSGSCGPSGKMLKPYGDLEPEELFEGFVRQVRAMSDAGVDIICVETMTDLTEAQLAVKAVKEVLRELPVMATMTFNKIPRGYYTMMGVSIENAVNGLQEAGADIIGSNCSNGIDNMIEVTKQMRSLSTLPILIQANAGIPENKNGQLIYPESPDYFAERIKALINAGASIIGGCCGTTPKHIKAIRDVVDSLK